MRWWHAGDKEMLGWPHSQERVHGNCRQDEAPAASHLVARAKDEDARCKQIDAAADIREAGEIVHEARVGY